MATVHPDNMQFSQYGKSLNEGSSFETKKCGGNEDML